MAHLQRTLSLWRMNNSSEEQEVRGHSPRPALPEPVSMSDLQWSEPPALAACRDMRPGLVWGHTDPGICPGGLPGGILCSAFQKFSSS